MATLGRLPLGTVSGDEQDLVEPLVGLEPRVADLSCLGLGRLKEGARRSREATEGLLLGGERMPTLPLRVGRADLPELGGLSP